jgi:hypothetical protein
MDIPLSEQDRVTAAVAVIRADLARFERPELTASAEAGVRALDATMPLATFIAAVAGIATRALERHRWEQAAGTARIEAATEVERRIGEALLAMPKIVGSH